MANSKQTNVPQPLTDPQEVAKICLELAACPFITVDTEFMRDGTFWPRLCLVQLGWGDRSVAIDPLAEDMDLTPLFELMDNPEVLKVFHSARQDVEIFQLLAGRVPQPIFDTQIAAMVCGFGDSVGYEKLARSLAGARIDKSNQFTDWSRRPLRPAQIAYALSDVTHLQTIYLKLARQLEKNGRAAWLDEEMAVLTDPATYVTEPSQAWRRLKVRGRSPAYLGVLVEVAAWREHRARNADQSRNRILRDEAIQELAAERPTTIEAMANLRAVPRGLANGAAGERLLAAVARGAALSADELPKIKEARRPPKGIGPIMDLLKVLLKLRSEESGVSAKLIATTSDLEEIAMDDDASVAALNGWRRELFGADAVRLKSGKLLLGIQAGKVIIKPVGDANTHDNTDADADADADAAARAEPVSTAATRDS